MDPNSHFIFAIMFSGAVGSATVGLSSSERSWKRFLDFELQHKFASSTLLWNLCEIFIYSTNYSNHEVVQRWYRISHQPGKDSQYNLRGLLWRWEDMRDFVESQSKQWNFILGKDENSKAMTKLIDNKAIAGKLESNAFVAIKIESDKEEYIQFAKICKFTSQ